MTFILGMFGLGALLILVLSLIGTTLIFGKLFIMESKVKRMEKEEASNPTHKSELQILTESINEFFTDFGNFQNNINHRYK